MMRDTLALRLFLLLLVGAILSASAALWVSDAAYRRRQADDGRETAAARVALALQVLPAGATLPGVRLADPTPQGRPDPAFDSRLNETLGSVRAAAYAAPLSACLPTPPSPAPPPTGTPPPRGPVLKSAVGPRSAPAARLPVGPVEQNCRLVIIETSDGQVGLTVALPPDPAPLTADRFGLLFLSVLGLAAALLAWLAARLSVRPLRQMAVAASDLGDDLDRAPLQIRGPYEVREAAAAFNTMQIRLKALMADRTRMLAAITHDLQTPLTRMRLRLDKVADIDLRARLLSDFTATQVLIHEGLDLARETGSSERWGQVDIPSLVDALVEDMADAGLPVKVTGRCAAVVRSQPQAIRRALGNLIDNAIKHGGSAEVDSSLTPGGRVVITVRDYGVGIPDDQLTAVFEPFQRLEVSRSRDSGGAGLGLTIARRLSASSGAILTLRNHPDGGLEAQLSFDRSSSS
jgi:signal transduction histidine kinase